MVKYHIKENSFIALLAAKKLNTSSVAIVIGSTIYLHNSTRKQFLNNPRWLRHELEHVRQFRHHGFLPFIIKYCWESLRVGYYNNKFELEARKAENETYDAQVTNATRLPHPS